MKNIFTTIACCFSIFSMAQTVQPRSVGTFNEISVTQGIKVEITQGLEEAVSVSSSKDAFTEKIITVVENGVLKIYYENKDETNKKEGKLVLKAYVTYKMIDKLLVQSAASIVTKNTLSAPRLILNMNSAAQFKGDIKVTDFTLEQNSGAWAYISGTAMNLNANLNSGAACISPNLYADVCSVVASSGSMFKITVNKTISAKVNSGAVVRYKGAAVVLKKNVHSGGKFKKM